MWRTAATHNVGAMKPSLQYPTSTPARAQARHEHRLALHRARLDCARLLGNAVIATHVANRRGSDYRRSAANASVRPLIDRR